MKTIVIIGAGNGISYGVAEIFGDLGFNIVLISRSKKALAKYHALDERNIPIEHFLCDASDSSSLAQTLAAIIVKYKKVEVLHYNVAVAKTGRIIDESGFSLTEDFQTNAANLLVALKEVLPVMEKEKCGTILLTGGGFALYPDQQYASLSIGKAALRALYQILAVELKNKKITVGMVTICGNVDELHEVYNPRAIAGQFLKLYQGKASVEIVY